MNVIVYSTPTCPYCDYVKSFLKENKIQFIDVNVAADKEKAMEMIKKTGQMAVPVTEINGKIIIGFDREAIKKALNLK